MAVSFSSLSKSVYYTSDLQTIDISTMSNQVEFRIYYQARIFYSGDGRTEIFRSTYYTRFNSVTIYDIAGIIESYMQENGLSVNPFVLWAKADSDETETTSKTRLRHRHRKSTVH